MITRTRTLIAATICALVAFFTTLILYWLKTSNPISARIHYAVFMSVVPALPVLIALISRRLSAKVVVLIYVVGFVALSFIQAGLR